MIHFVKDIEEGRQDCVYSTGHNLAQDIALKNITLTVNVIGMPFPDNFLSISNLKFGKDVCFVQSFYFYTYGNARVICQCSFKNTS